MNLITEPFRIPEIKLRIVRRLSSESENFVPPSVGHYVYGTINMQTKQVQLTIIKPEHGS